MAMGGVGEAMLLNAAIGGTVSAVAGGDPLKGALLGGLSGGIMGGAAGAGTGAVPTGLSSTGASAGLSQPVGAALNNVSAYVNPASLGADAATALQGAVPGAMPAGGAMGVSGAGDFAQVVGAANVPTGVMGTPISALTLPAPDRGILGGMVDKFKALPFEKQLLYGGLGGLGAISMLQGMGQNVPEGGKYEGPLSKFRYDPRRYRPSPFAGGGIAALAPVAMAHGGISDLGSYSDGGRMLRGPGDGMSDNIPGVIGGQRPARLADGEFVVPADVVSHLGNGSTNAGAKQLYAMMDRVRQARTGSAEQGKQINPMRAMPA